MSNSKSSSNNKQAGSLDNSASESSYQYGITLFQLHHLIQSNNETSKIDLTQLTLKEVYETYILPTIAPYNCTYVEYLSRPHNTSNSPSRRRQLATAEVIVIYSWHIKLSELHTVLSQNYQNKSPTTAFWIDVFCTTPTSSTIHAVNSNQDYDKYWSNMIKDQCKNMNSFALILSPWEQNLVFRHIQNICK